MPIKTLRFEIKQIIIIILLLLGPSPDDPQPGSGPKLVDPQPESGYKYEPSVSLETDYKSIASDVYTFDKSPDYIRDKVNML